MKFPHRIQIMILLVIGNGALPLYPQTEDTSERIQHPLSFIQQVKETFHFNANVSLGGEWDDNAKKTYSTSDTKAIDDQVIRVFINTDGKYKFDPTSFFNFSYQGGAKKYFDVTEEDTILNQVKLGFHKSILPPWQMGTIANFNIKNEQEESTEGAEDYYLASGEFYSLHLLRDYFLSFTFNGKYTFFKFLPNDQYSFHRGRYGATTKYTFYYPFDVSAEYHYQNQWFFEPVTGASENRQDNTHEVAGYIGLERDFISRVGFVYQNNHSNVSTLSSQTYRAVFQFSWLFPWDMTLLLLVNFQLRDYEDPAATTEETARAIQTSAEEENFNSLAAKLSQRIFASTYLEAKYSRYSNEFSRSEKNEDPFQRNVYHLALRYEF